MGAHLDDRTARARIRDEALRLFAERNAEAVTLREIAAAAGVSASLVVQHYGSKNGLREAVDEYAVAVLDAALSAATDHPDAFDPARSGGIAERIARRIPPGSSVLGYLGKLLIEPGPRGTEVFERLHAVARQTLGRLVDSGLATDGGDPAARAAVLLVNDLAVILLRDRIGGVLGIDPLSAEGLARWGRQVLLIYAGGLTMQTTTAGGRGR